METGPRRFRNQRESQVKSDIIIRWVTNLDPTLQMGLDAR
jgi:hypothetical protein